MRNVIRGSLMVAVVLTTVALVNAQPRPGQGFDPGPAILNSEDVQKELKLTDEQVKAIGKISTEMQTKMKDAFQGGKIDREAMQKIQDESKAAYGKVITGLKPEQQKRFDQLLLQAKGLRAFSDEKVQTSMKLTAEQKEKFKGLADDLQKDSAEIRKEFGRDAFTDKEKAAEMQKKISALSTKTMEKITKELNEDQKKAWKDLTGDEFKGKLGTGGFGFPRPGGDKKIID